MVMRSNVSVKRLVNTIKPPNEEHIISISRERCSGKWSRGFLKLFFSAVIL
jgi:hypothetical protein